MEYNKITQKLPQTFSLYSKLFFMAICDYKKALLSLLFIRLRLFLLLIDFLLYIMGTQIQMKIWRFRCALGWTMASIMGNWILMEF